MSTVANDLINLKNNTARVQYQQGQDRIAQGNRELDNNAFLQLMLAQLRNQDPTNPMDQSQFLQQQAAFTQIEKLENLTAAINSNNQVMQASNLVGKTVVVEDEFQNQKEITVDSVLFDGQGQVVLRHGEDMYSAAQVVEIKSGSGTQLPVSG